MRASKSTHPAAIATIPPMPEDVERPFWSVMIPTYNCDALFEQALRSVLDQDPGPDRMQITIVDDGSTSRLHEELIRELAPSRVELFRQPANVGLAGNWNTCIERSRGRWVHIFHQDDLVLPGFYEALSRAVSERPDAGAAFCRHGFIDGEGRQHCLSTLLRPTAGILDDWIATIAQKQHIQCPSIVVRRDVYEDLGGFRSDLVYSLDWEMWVRIAAHYPVWFEPEPLACYRNHGGNETERLKRGNRDIHDARKAVRHVYAHVPPALRSTIRRAWFDDLRDAELRLTCEALAARDLRLGVAKLLRAIEWDPSLAFSRAGFAYYKWALKVWLGKWLPIGQWR